jgi:hypothetical protein
MAMPVSRMLTAFMRLCLRDEMANETKRSKAPYWRRIGLVG